MKRTSVWILFLFVCISVSAQKIAVKTNLLYDVTTTLNLGAEFRVAPKWTIVRGEKRCVSKFGRSENI